MRIRVFLFSVSLAVAASFTPTKAKTLRAETSSSVALTGQVTSAEEGPMEGVIVSAKKAGSTITVSVVSDEQGRYRLDRKSTRLNSSHITISYAVFCLKK